MLSPGPGAWNPIAPLISSLQQIPFGTAPLPWPAELDSLAVGQSSLALTALPMCVRGHGVIRDGHQKTKRHLDCVADTFLPLAWSSLRSPSTFLKITSGLLLLASWQAARWRRQMLKPHVSTTLLE